jgi:hypothetical protein
MSILLLWENTYYECRFERNLVKSPTAKSLSSLSVAPPLIIKSQKNKKKRKRESFSYIVSVSFVGGENHRPVAGDCDKRYHMMLHRVMKYTMKVAMYKISQ